MTDIASINPVVKQTHRLAFEEATTLARQALDAANFGTKSRVLFLTLLGDQNSDDIFKMAEERYKDSININPQDYRGTFEFLSMLTMLAFHNWGLSLMYRATKKQGMEAENLFKFAESKWKVSTSFFMRVIPVSKHWI